jgi:hypothetical protein
VQARAEDRLWVRSAKNVRPGLVSAASGRPLRTEIEINGSPRSA